MKNFEILAFRLIAVGTKFFDAVSGEDFRKVSATQAECLTGGDAFEGKRADFGPFAETRAEIPAGYQIADASGANIQGDDNDPSGYTSYEVLTRELAQRVINQHPGENLQLFAIYAGDIEQPDFLA